LTVHQPSRRLVVLLWLSFAFFVVYVTTLPFDFDPFVEHARQRLAGVSRNPLLSSDGSRASRSDMLQNVVLFVPFGGLTALVLLARPRRLLIRESSGRQAGAPGRALTVLLLSVLGGSALSAAVETLQLFTVDRVSSLNDVLTNTVGALLGGIIVLLISRVAERTRAAPHATDILHRCYPLLLWTGVASIAAWHPFDTTIDVSSAAGKVRALLSNPWQASALGDEGVDAVRYALFAISWAVVWKRWHLPQPVVAAAFAATLLGAVLETSQFFVLSRMPGLKDVAVAMAGGSAGAVLSQLARRWAMSTAAAVTIAATWLAAGMMLINPGIGSVGPQPIQYTPFLGYLQPAPEFVVSHAVELTLAFFPIGFALGMVVRGRRVWLLTTVVALLLGASLEYGQSWIIGRYADVTDVGVLILGALAGAWAALPARSESRAAGEIVS
jgi:VanZ family protein